MDYSTSNPVLHCLSEFMFTELVMLSNHLILCHLSESFQSKGLLRVFSGIRIWKHRFFGAQSSLASRSHNLYVIIWTFVGKAMSLLFTMLSRFVIAFLPRSRHLLILWPQSLSAVILEPKNIESVTVFTFPLVFAMKTWDQLSWS